MSTRYVTRSVQIDQAKSMTRISILNNSGDLHTITKQKACELFKLWKFIRKSQYAIGITFYKYNKIEWCNRNTTYVST
jgi:hypothetical protein